mgnify:CR=1|jgi:hypothetical protein|nr:MAG: hypothetical protein DIU57_11015 [Pseudomonadota bacterium]
MIKLVAVGLWICAVTLAAGFAAVSWKTGAVPEPGDVSLLNGLSTVKTRLISVPVIADGEVQGYVVTQLSFAVDSSLLNRLSIKPDLILVDEAIKTIYSGGDIDFRRMKRQDLPALTKKLAENANARFGGNLVREVFVEELNYISKDQVRRSLVQ